MTVPDLLMVFLAAAITLMGFAGIVALIDRGAAKVSHEIASFRVRALVGMSLAVVMLSVAPLLAVLLGAGREAWLVGSGIQAAILIACVIQIVTVRHRLHGEQAQGMTLRSYRAMMVVGLAVAGLLIAGAVGFVSASAAYATGVFWFLLGAASIFARLVFTLDDSMRNRGPGSGP